MPTFALLLLAAVLVTAAAPAWADTRHAGNVLEVDAAAGRLVIEEMAPGSRTTRIEVSVIPTTRLLEVRREPVEVVVSESARTRNVAVTYRWVEQPLALASIRAGDFAVVEIGDPPAAGEPSPATRVEVTSRAP